MPGSTQLMHNAGSGSQSVPGHISNAAYGAAGVYTTQHIAQQFTYTLDASSNLAASSDYVAVLHFAGKPLPPCSRSSSASALHVPQCPTQKAQLGSCDPMPTYTMPFQSI